MPVGFASAADMPVKAFKALPPELPFFLVIDDRVTYSYIFNAAQPGAYTVRPNGTVDGKTTKQVYSFTHFDAWANTGARLAGVGGGSIPSGSCNMPVLSMTLAMPSTPARMAKSSKRRPSPPS